MDIGDIVSKTDVQKCWVLHEYKVRGEDIGKDVIALIERKQWEDALYKHRGTYPREVFDSLVIWKRATLYLNDLRNLRHVDCWINALSNRSMKISDAVETIVHDPDFKDSEYSEVQEHIQYILNHLETLANDNTPIIVGRDFPDDRTVKLYDGFHRVAASLIYYRKEKVKQFKAKDAYYGF